MQYYNVLSTYNTMLAVTLISLQKRYVIIDVSALTAWCMVVTYFCLDWFTFIVQMFLYSYKFVFFT